METAQVAPTILKALGLNPNQLQAVQMEHTQVLPAVQFYRRRRQPVVHDH